MAPDSLITLNLLLAATVGVACLVAAGWDRVRGASAWLLRPVAVLLCVTTAVATALVGLDHELEFYDSWGELFGGPAVATAAPREDIMPAGLGHGRVVETMISDARLGLSLPAYVYLPPGYQVGASAGLHYPVIEALHGFPGSPASWVRGLAAPDHLDQEIAAGRMAPTVVVFPYLSPRSTQDTECVNAVGGLQMDTYLTTTVRQAMLRRYSVRADPAAWGLIGYSLGGYCAVNLAMRHPDRYAAAASLSGYFQASTDWATGDLYRGDLWARELNSPIWRLQHQSPPRLSIYLACATDDRSDYADLTQFVALARPPLRVTTALFNRGGHTHEVWLAVEAPSFDFLSAALAAPVRRAGSGSLA
jgi:pimeloyl-ACP methyl ester carboxylesterase